MNIPVDTTFVAAYNPSPVDFGSLSQETSSVTTVLEITGGVLPYTIVSVIFVGGAPAAGVSLTLTTTDVTDDTVAVTTTAATPAASYSGTIRARVDDAEGRSLTVDVDYDFVEIAVFADIESFLDSLSITHRWKCDDASPGPMLDSGNGTTRDLAAVGTLGWQGTGPDDSTLNVDGNTSSDWARNSSGGMDEASSGTILAFVLNPASGGVIISQNNTVNEAFQLQFARNPIFEVSGTPRIGFTAMLANQFERRVFEGSTDTNSHNADGLWHLYAFVQEGIGALPRMYIDGVEETVFSTPTGASPPPIDIWTDIGDANSRVVAWNGRFGSASGNWTRNASEVCVLNGVIMDSTQLTALFDLITN